MLCFLGKVEGVSRGIAVHTLLIDIKLPKYLHVGVGLVSKYCSADDMSRVCTERKL